jgi:hypothetical protein
MPNNASQVELSCLYYPQFLVKELNDPGIKGSLWVTVISVADKQAPACRLAHASAERFIAKDGWYFDGVKGPLVFLQASDGNGMAGVPFRVMDAKTGKKIFEDSAYGERENHIGFAHAADGSMTLEYMRGVEGDCSIPKDGMSCWRKFRELYGLVVEAMPACIGYRHEGDKEWVVGDPGVPPDDVRTPSDIVYPVSVMLFPHPSIKAVPGPVKCGPQQ